MTESQNLPTSTVYGPVNSWRVGKSLGIDLLFTNSICSFRCVYCQLGKINEHTQERKIYIPTEKVLADLQASQWQEADVITFSGNGEPTAAAAFPEAVASVRDILAARGLAAAVKIRLITNGSLVHRRAVQAGIRAIGEAGGEVWFKVDRVGEAATRAINGVPSDPAKVLRNLRRTAALALTWVQTCWFAIDGAAPTAEARDAYCAWLGEAAASLAASTSGVAEPVKPTLRSERPSR